MTNENRSSPPRYNTTRVVVTTIFGDSLLQYYVFSQLKKSRSYTGIVRLPFISKVNEGNEKMNSHSLVIQTATDNYGFEVWKIYIAKVNPQHSNQPSTGKVQDYDKEVVATCPNKH